MTQVTIKSTGKRGQVIVNGHDISNAVGRVEIVWNAGSIPFLMLQVIPSRMDLDFEDVDIKTKAATWIDRIAKINADAIPEESNG